jgi:hypothetical protein
VQRVAAELFKNEGLAASVVGPAAADAVSAEHLRLH